MIKKIKESRIGHYVRCPECRAFLEFEDEDIEFSNLYNRYIIKCCNCGAWVDVLVPVSDGYENYLRTCYTEFIKGE